MRPIHTEEKLIHLSAPKSAKSPLVSFEGPEGSGKSTQIAKFSQFLKAQRSKVSVFREPGGTPFGEDLRTTILSQKEPLHPLAQAHLFASARAQLIAYRLMPLIETSGQIVILDRFIDSSLVYQGIVGKLGLQTILNIHSHPPLNIVPHITFLLDIPIAVSLDRQRKRGGLSDYFESQASHFHGQVIAGMQRVAGLFSHRIVLINGDQSEEDVHCDIIDKWTSWYNAWSEEKASRVR